MLSSPPARRRSADSPAKSFSSRIEIPSPVIRRSIWIPSRASRQLCSSNAWGACPTSACGRSARLWPSPSTAPAESVMRTARRHAAPLPRPPEWPGRRRSLSARYGIPRTRHRTASSGPPSGRSDEEDPEGTRRHASHRTGTGGVRSASEGLSVASRPPDAIGILRRELPDQDPQQRGIALSIGVGRAADLLCESETCLLRHTH